jgi:hypothetical protein
VAAAAAAAAAATNGRTTTTTISEIAPEIESYWGEILDRSAIH